jgi:hypothetical protein
MATTTNFGWETPDDTDLVKDGALAMRTLGNAIDTSLVDLKGGTTGQVLSKTSNTDMDFTWVTTDDANAIQNAIVDAKGDLITATAADVPARLAVGSNGDTLVADSAATTGLRWQGNYAAGKNKIINGDMNIWQRGTSFTSGSGYTADRFNYLGGVTTPTVTRGSITTGTSGLPESIRYCAELTGGTAGTTGYYYFSQYIENVDTFANQTITISFYAKGSVAGTAALRAAQDFGSGGSSAVFLTNIATSTVGATFTVSTSWQRFSATFTVPSISGKTIGTNNLLNIGFVRNLGSTFTATNFGIPSLVDYSGTLSITGVQVEAGSVATAFQTATGTLQGELAACQRYYQVLVDGLNKRMGTASQFTTTDMRWVHIFPVTMRTAPTLSATSGASYYYFERNGGTDNFDSLTMADATTQTCLLYNNTEISGTAGQAGNAVTNSASAKVAFSAEL